MDRSKKNIGNDLGLRNVLISRFSALGDVAMTVPVVYSVCQAYPDVRFVMVTRPSMTGIFVNAPSNLVLVGADVKCKYKGVLGLRRLVNELVDEYGIDAFVDLHDVLRTQVMRFWARMRGIRHVTKLNKGRSHKRALTRSANKVMLPLDSSRARYRAAFHRCGLPIEMTFRGLYDGNKAPDAAYSHITGCAKPAGEIWVGIAPFAAHQGKVYPLDKMESVAKALDERDDCRIFLFGAGPHEQEVSEKWAEKYPSVTSLAGKKYGFAAELALLSHLDVMLTMDSANMHLAAIAGARTVSIWGATHYYCGFKGWHQSENDMIQVPLSCRPCSVFGDKPCMRHDLLCLNAIRPEVVVKKIETILNEPRI